MTAIVCFIVVLVREKELHLNVETVVSIYIQKTVLKSIIDYETPSVLVYFDYIINFVILTVFAPILFWTTDIFFLRKCT